MPRLMPRSKKPTELFMMSVPLASVPPPNQDPLDQVTLRVAHLVVVRVVLRLSLLGFLLWRLFALSSEGFVIVGKLVVVVVIVVVVVVVILVLVLAGWGRLLLLGSRLLRRGLKSTPSQVTRRERLVSMQ